VTNILLPQAAHRTPQEALLCAKAKRLAANVLSVRKRQQQSAQAERKSTTRFVMNHKKGIKHYLLMA